jgi:hypothetical protein
MSLFFSIVERDGAFRAVPAEEATNYVNEGYKVSDIDASRLTVILIEGGATPELGGAVFAPDVVGSSEAPLAAVQPEGSIAAGVSTEAASSLEQATATPIEVDATPAEGQVIAEIPVANAASVPGTVVAEVPVDQAATAAGSAVIAEAAQGMPVIAENAAAGTVVAEVPKEQAAEIAQGETVAAEVPAASVAEVAQGDAAVAQVSADAVPESATTVAPATTAPLVEQAAISDPAAVSPVEIAPGEAVVTSESPQIATTPGEVSTEAVVEPIQGVDDAATVMGGATGLPSIPADSIVDRKAYFYRVEIR